MSGSSVTLPVLRDASREGGLTPCFGTKNEPNCGGDKNLERSTVGLRAAEADGEPPHPPFGHVLPVGDKGTVNASAKPSDPGQAAKRSPSPRRGEGRGEGGFARAQANREAL